jgi:hypothetical protein
VKNDLEMNQEELDNFKQFLQTKKGRILVGQVLSILRGIEFVDRPKTEEEAKQIFSQGFTRISSIKLDISYNQYISGRLAWKRKSAEIQEDIVDYLMTTFSPLSNGNREEFCRIFEDTIKKNLLNEFIFKLPATLLAGQQEISSLFYMLSSKNPADSASVLLVLIYVNLSDSVTQWLVIYPITTIKSSSYTLGFDGITLYNPSDTELWRKLCAEYEDAKQWHPSQSQSSELRFGGIREPIYKLSNFPASAWLICENTGTSDGVREDSYIKMRTFIAALFSQLYLNQSVLNKSSSRPHTYCKQFPVNNNFSGYREVNASIGEIVPPLMSDLEVSDDLFKHIKNWYIRKNALPEETKRRVQVASQFIHYGIIADGIERFIHFFVVLDALFGERGNVEAKITAGVKAIFSGDALWEYKISRLFKLRSSLVHGGCSSILDWVEIDSYRRHTKSHPLTDVITAAMTAFKKI